jgi:hypothetical protein
MAQVTGIVVLDVHQKLCFSRFPKVVVMILTLEKNNNWNTYLLASLQNLKTYEN